MGKINGCLKCLFIFFNVLFALCLPLVSKCRNYRQILGCLLIYGATKSSAYRHQLSVVGTPGLIWLIAIGVFGISCLGIYAGFSEKEILLKIFAGFMGVGMIIILIFGIIMVDTGNKIKSSFDSTESFMEDEELKTMLDGLQQTAHCCGLVGASDWGGNIPSSCKCSGYGYGGYGGSECKSKPQGVCGPDRIYAQPCEIILLSIDLVLKIAMGLCFGFAVTALLGLLVSCLMIHQVQHYDDSGEKSIVLRDTEETPDP